jgi:hypothetical protein
MISTTITWAPVPAGFDTNFAVELSSLALAMKQQGSTDGVVTQIGPTTYVRNWVDQATADAFIVAVQQLATKYNRAIVSHVTNVV